MEFIDDSVLYRKFGIMSDSSMGISRRNKKFSNGGGSGNEDGDLLSNLPECVLSCILSCLPTKDAVRTSVLSKAWEYRWTSIYNITLRDHILFSGQRNDEACFVKFVDRILLNSQNIKSFDLCCYDEYDRKHIETWLAALFRRNVEVVTLDVVETKGAVLLSRSLLDCTSLRKLKICMFCTWKVPVKLYFPNLTSLYLEDVIILNDNPSTDTLTFTFPVLATLQLRKCTWLKVKLVEFYAPCLNTFISDPMFDVPLDDYLIKICGARLDEFISKGINVEKFLLAGTTVRYAHLEVMYHIGEEILNIGFRTRRLLAELSSTSELTLSCYIAQVIAQTKSGIPLPKFNKLGRLELYGGTALKNHIASIDVLFELLHAAPFLEGLAIDMDDVIFMETEDGYEYESVPPCLSHLKTVQLIHFMNNAHQLRLAMYLLEHGTKLHTFLFNRCRVDKVELAKQTSKFPEASTYVRIMII